MNELLDKVTEPPNQLSLDLGPTSAASVLKLIHRGQDSYVAFMSKDNPERVCKNLFSIPVAEIERLFPAIAPYLVREAYFSVNGMYCAAPYTNPTTGLPSVWRTEKKHIRYLNACYVDIDVGRMSEKSGANLTSPEAEAKLRNLMESGVLPHCSIFAHSGRGLYAFWLLCDEIDESMPPRGWPERIALYKAVNLAIIERLEVLSLAPDHVAHDATRMLKVPGTLHHLVQQPARYSFQADDNGIYKYTLNSLAKAFGVTGTVAKLPRNTRALSGNFASEDWIDEGDVRGNLSVTEIFGSVPRRRTINPGSTPNRRNGLVVLNARRAQDLLTLAQDRGGWKKGRRRKMLELFGRFLCGSGATKAEVLDCVAGMAATCRPPYPSDPNDSKVKLIVDQVFQDSPKNYGNQLLVEWLGVTSDDAERLNLLTIVPKDVQISRMPPKGGKKAQERAERRRFLTNRIAAIGRLESTRQYVELLAQEGIPSTPQTVNLDLVALGHGGSARARAGRPKKSETGALPLDSE